MGGRKDDTARIRAVRPLCIMTATGHVPAAPVQHSVFIVGKEIIVKNVKIAANTMKSTWWLVPLFPSVNHPVVTTPTYIPLLAFVYFYDAEEHILN